MKTADIRQSFLDFFARHDHKVVPSGPVIPYNDPTILFTNAGMNQFKDVFTGQRKVDYSRATSSQKCIRAGGKHNDLDNVGFTARHHTFFEMLGNFSFGDYYKEGAIEYAWEWVTKDLGLEKDRLYASVYEEDDEAFDLWEKIAPELKGGRVMRFGKKDNFWAMGDTGPCGPNSEIHYDRGERYGVGPEHCVNGETDRFVEIWNLVFMQYDRSSDGSMIPLPKPSVDTGAGLERLASILQNVDSNYGIDLFINLMKAISDVTGASYETHRVSHQVVADHLRALTFAIADGAGISNEGQGYVLRRILRRAARHGRLLGAEEPFIYKLVPVLIDEMGAAFPEIREKQSHVENVIRTEEESFNRTLETGLNLFDKVAVKVRKTGQTVVPGEEVFRLYDTYGFPYDLTEIIAAEQGLTLDKQGFDSAMEAQKEKSRAGADFGVQGDGATRALIGQLEAAGLTSHPTTEFVRETLSLDAQILAAVVESDTVAVILDRSPFYVEAGGQIGDIGTIAVGDNTLQITSLENHLDYYVHIGSVTSGATDAFTAGASVTASVSETRRWDIMRNHTATHLAHAALREVLGDHVKQSGSYVGPDRLRFDFSHHQPMTDDEVDRVEEIVNEQILRGEAVNTDVMDIEQAKASGAMALFGEKYADTVRVVSVPGFSKELCGGTHVQNVSQIGPFFVVLETGIASGVRRIEAITGHEAVRHMLGLKSFRRDVARTIGRPEADALDGVRHLADDRSALQKELKKTKAEMFSGGGQSIGTSEKIGPVTFMSHDFGETDRDIMASWIDTQKGSGSPVVAGAFGVVNGKATFIASASGPAEKDHKVHVGNLVKEVLPKFGGRGGGKPSFAQGSVETGTDAARLFEVAREILKVALKV